VLHFVGLSETTHSFGFDRDGLDGVRNHSLHFHGGTYSKIRYCVRQYTDSDTTPTSTLEVALTRHSVRRGLRRRDTRVHMSSGVLLVSAAAECQHRLICTRMTRGKVQKNDRDRRLLASPKPRSVYNGVGVGMVRVRDGEMLIIFVIPKQSHPSPSRCRYMPLLVCALTRRTVDFVSEEVKLIGCRAG